MKNIKVCVRAKILEEFKKEAKVAWPSESYAILLGHFSEVSGFEIIELFFPGNLARYASPDEIKIQSSWFKEAYLYARASNLTVLGDLHSHPHGELGPSECDLDEQTASSFAIFGICGINKTKRGLRARIRFWPSGTMVKTKVT